MKKWHIYMFGIITGFILTYALAFCIKLSNNSGIVGLDIFEEPGDYMDYSQLEVFQVLPSGCALAFADGPTGEIAFIIPTENQHFYDEQKIIIKNNQRVQCVGTYKYDARIGVEKTVPAIKIIVGEKTQESSGIKAVDNSGKTFFEQPGECVSRKDFQVQKVLESGDAIALEIKNTISGNVFTSDLEVLILAGEGRNFYYKQIVKAPQGKCARQIGNYKYRKYGDTKVIPIIDFK